MRSFPLIYSVALLFFVGKSNVLVRGFSIDPKTPKSSLFHKQMKANPSEPTFPGISSLECRQLVESSCTTSSLQLSGGANGDVVGRSWYKNSQRPQNKTKEPPRRLLQVMLRWVGEMERQETAANGAGWGYASTFMQNYNNSFYTLKCVEFFEFL